jgi:hypothetical protein
MAYYKQQRERYVDLKINGRLFPSWVLSNFRKYKIPEVIVKGDEDPCARKTKLELRVYQTFLSKFMDYKSPYHNILVYHGLGSGKTVSAINIYNMLYNYTPGWNVFILIKAALKDHPWMTDLQRFLTKEEYQFRMDNVIFVSYDSPIADKQFMEAVRNADSSKKSLYIVDEAHNFIRNVYSNINSKQGKRAQIIYDYILQDKKENEGVRVVLLSATPAINVPFELALMFNLLRPGIFPRSEAQFNQLFVTSSNYPTINPTYKNMFQRRIMGLVSYYYGSTPDLYATKTIQYIDVPMSEYQSEIYAYYEEIEEIMARKKRKSKGGSSTYKSYTRQASNFVFPPLNQDVTGETRPRPSKFRISEKEAEAIEEGKQTLKMEKGSDTYLNVQKYLKTLDMFLNSFDDHLNAKQQEDEKSGRTIMQDYKIFVETYKGNFNDFVEKEEITSKLFEAMYKSSAKMVNIIFNLLGSPGPVLVYSNYVLMEGLQIFKIYLKYFGYTSFSDKDKGEDGKRYMEFHGGINREERSKNINIFNDPANKYGKICKLYMISPAGSEGISLRNMRQVHIMESYWHEVRITQVIGRAIRACYHQDLPLNERHVDVFRYRSTRKDSNKITTDQYIEDLARSKQNLIDSFLDSVKQVAVDCGLYKNVNMMAEEYKCFQFDEPSLFDDQIGATYKDDLYDDMKIDNGSNSTKSQTMRIKVKKIKAVKQLSIEDSQGNVKYSKPEEYWYNSDTQVVYDLELHFAIGKVGLDDDNLPIKIDNETYVITRLVPIPLIDEVK